MSAVAVWGQGVGTLDKRGGQCMGGGKREGGEPDSQGSRKREVGKNHTTLHNIFQSKKCKEVGASIQERKLELKGMESGKFEVCPPSPLPPPAATTHSQEHSE